MTTNSYLTAYGAARGVNAGMGASVASVDLYLGLATCLPNNPRDAVLSQFDDYELTTASYARQLTTWLPATTNYPATTYNATDLSFGPFTVAPSTVTYCFLCSASSGSDGYVHAFWQLDTAACTIANGYFAAPVGALTLNIS